MAAARSWGDDVLNINEAKIIYDRTKDDLVRSTLLIAFPELKQDFSKKKNKCAWLKIGKREVCGKRCKDVFCSKHSQAVLKGGRVPLPCSVCWVGVKNSENICKTCRLTEDERERSVLLAKELADLLLTDK